MNTEQTITQNLHWHLANFVKNMNRGDLRTVDALLIDLTGNDTAARMLIRLIFWWPYAKKPGGWVYKSAFDWYAECRLSRSKVSSVHSKGILEAIGIERKNMKANGNPTIHYRLNIPQFLQALAEFAGIAVEQVKEWMQLENPTNNSQESEISFSENPKEDFSENRDFVFQDSGKSITTNKQTNKNKQINDKQQTNNTVAVVQEKKHSPENFSENRLKKIPLLPRWLASLLVKEHGFEFVQAVSNYAVKQKSLNNPVGWVRSELKKNNLKLNEKTEPVYAEDDYRRYLTGPYAVLFTNYREKAEAARKGKKSPFDEIETRGLADGADIDSGISGSSGPSKAETLCDSD